MLDYFAPKTRHVKLADGVGYHKTSRGGYFKIDILNDQYDSHFFRAYTAIDCDTGTWLCGLHNNVMNGKSVNNIEKNKFSFKKRGFKTEQEAADALDAYAAKLTTRLLNAYLAKLLVECDQVENLILSYKTSHTKESAKK